jgi:hypothetical protein
MILAFGSDTMIDINKATEDMELCDQAALMAATLEFEDQGYSFKKKTKAKFVGLSINDFLRAKKEEELIENGRGEKL